MKELGLIIKGRGETKGFMFSQVLRSGNAYIYEVQAFNQRTGEKKGQKHYEVFKRQVSKECIRNIKGKIVSFPEYVIYPHNEAFGLWAWTFNCFGKAVDKFNELSAMDVKAKAA